MGKTWSDLGQGQRKLVLTDDASGAVLSTFYGTTDQILDKLVDSQVSAGRRISELRNGNGATPAPATAPKPLSAADRMQVVSDLTSPATVDRGIARVVESVVGPIEELRHDREASQLDRQERAAVAAAEAFAEDTLDWYPSEYNKNTLVRYLQTQGLNPTAKASYTQAFEALTAAKLLEPKPAEPEPGNTEPELHPERERNAPTPTPRTAAPSRYSTSIRHSDISGTRPAATIRLKYTREQIANMSAQTYKRLLTGDPELSRAVDFYAEQDRRKTARRTA